jgi:FlaA1/EpsC-like NDP-sugar epimerase
LSSLTGPATVRARRLGRRIFWLSDPAVMVAAVTFAYVVRFEGWSWLGTDSRPALTFLALAVPAKMIVFTFAGLYRRLWRYASVTDLERILVAVVCAAVLGFVIGVYVVPIADSLGRRMPLSVLVLDAVLTAAAVALTRLLARVLYRRLQRADIAGARPAIIAGAGAAGGLIAKELLENPHLGLRPVGFVDDDRAKHGQRLHGVPVLGALASLPEAVQKTGAVEVVVAMPSATGKAVRAVVRAAQEAGVLTRTVPGLSEIISGRKAVSALRRVEIEDLLRREPISTDLRQVRSLATDATVLITGAGGSIGSELCRQIAQLAPARIIAVGRGENSIFELLHELRTSFPGVTVVPVIADVRDYLRMEAVFERYRPRTVFHAAAHKHVPLMEANVAEAVLNNILGTRNVGELAARCGTKHFVLISTDKAVRPTSVMGATKRIAEQIIHDMFDAPDGSFVSVRFGNVLGSRGSVVPVFLRQIVAGGPVTVTHPEMRRYFMTIPEAVQLVLQAGALGRSREVFVLDMGEPVKIADLAADLIRLSGLEVGNDVEIQFTGMRPGEKLYEELFFDAENAAPTDHAKILRAMHVTFAPGAKRLVEDLIEAARANRPEAELRRMISRLVPDYQVRGESGDEAPRALVAEPVEPVEPLAARVSAKAVLEASP